MKNQKQNPKNVKRRDFLKIVSLTGVGGIIASGKSFASVLQPSTASKVVVVRDTTATDKTSKTVNADVVENMVDTGIKNYTGMDDVGEAWKSIFPGITTGSIIGLKVNTLFATKNTGTHPQVAYAVAKGLAKMNIGGSLFPENNIIIFDFHNNYLTYEGYTINKTSTGVRCYPTPEYTTETYDIAGVKVKLSKVITETITYMVNIAYLKQHFLSGVSLCLKNHYGSIQNPEISGLLHDSSRYGSPYIPAITALEPVRSKQKFCIIDALYGVTVNGPSGVPTVNPDKIIMGQDVVAVDYTGRELLKSVGLSTTQYNHSVHIDVAATSYSLGTNDPASMNVVAIDNSPDAIEDISDGGDEKFMNAPNPFGTDTEISFYIHTAGLVQMNIYAYNGRQVASLISRHMEEGMHTFRWNGRDASGNDLPNGVYICELYSGADKRSMVMQKFK